MKSCTSGSHSSATSGNLPPRVLAAAVALLLIGSFSAGTPPVVLAQAPTPALETDQVQEPETFIIDAFYSGFGGSVAPLEQDLCEPSARWLRIRFRALILKGDDSLTLSGTEGGAFTFRGRRWENRSFFTRAFRGSCVRLSANLADPGSWFQIEALQIGTEALAATPVVVAGAGDICGSSCAATSDVIVSIDPASVFTAGDNAYSDGTLSEFNTKYDPTWGRFKSITRPSPGNHDYHTAGASGYFDYFNGVGQSTGPAGDRSTGYYSYDIGDWHLIALNSNLAVSAGSTQEQWLRADLAANTKPCTLAYWHHPRFSRGSHGSNSRMQPLWQALYDFKADVVVNGHDHNYQRFAPQTPSGIADLANGIREFVAGTGGAGLYNFTTTVANFEAGNTTDWGVLKLTLSSTGYSWNFVPIAGASFTDSGSGTCHNVSTGPDFGLGLSPTSLAVTQGLSGSVTVTVASVNGFTAPTDLRVSGLPDGVTASFSANPVTPPSGGTANSTLTLVASPTATIGTSSVTITGTSGAISHGANLTLTVNPVPIPDFSVALAPASLNVPQGSSGASTVTVTSLNGFTAPTDLSVSGLPSGVTASFSANPVTPPSGGSANSTLTLAASPAAAAGTSTLTITGTSGAVSHSSALTLITGPNLQTVEVRVSSSSDDAEQQSSSTNLSSSDLELTVDSVNQTVGMRFNGVSIPQGATVVTAYLQFKVDEISSTATTLTIFGQAADNPGTFTSASLNISSRTRTSASVSWTPPPWTTVGAMGPDQRTPDIAPVIQEIVGRPGWASGNSQVLIITGDGAGKRTAEAYDGDQAGAALLHVEYRIGPPPNQAPSVNAGPDQAVALPPGTASLAGAASDDGRPGPMSFLWTGPSGVSFSDPTSLATTATFAAVGIYTLTLTADDGELVASDDVVVTVAVNQAPIVDAGTNRTISLPPGTASLGGTASDDGLPGPMSFLWTGPSEVSFSNPTSVSTTATFAAVGNYTLTLTADDGELASSDTVVVTVDPASTNQPPSVNAGGDQTITLPSSATLSGTASDDGLPSGTLVTTWSQSSGPGVVTFANASALSTTASFSSAGVYELQLTGSDGSLSSSDLMTVTVTAAVEVKVATSSDDAEQKVATGKVSLTSSDLELTTDGTSVQIVGTRFAGVAIPPGATIVNAYIQFEVDEASSASAALTIQAQAADNAPTFATATGNLSARARTAASAPWAPAAWATVGARGLDQRTPDIASVIQEIVGRPGWASGNSLVILFSGTGKRVAESYNGDRTGAPLLHVEYR